MVEGAQASSLDFSMEANNGNNSSQIRSQSQQLEDEDRLSTLTDDILLSILGRLSLSMAARTCVLSTRWRHLPWLLPEVSIDVKEFISDPCPPDESDRHSSPQWEMRTMAFLVAAPSIEILHIEVWEHSCDVGEARLDSYLDRRTPQWEMRLHSSENRLLKDLEFAGFKSLEQQFTFIRSVLERSPSLQKIVLRGDEQCKYCDALEESPRPSKFPKKKDEQEIVAKQIRYGTFLPEIIFKE